MPAAPPDDYGYLRLRNSRRHRNPEDVAQAFLTDLLAANGYYDFAESVDRTVERAALVSGDEPAALSARPDEPA